MVPDRDTKIGRIFHRLTDLSSLPKVVEKLLMLSDAKASTRELADLIATDQGLSAKVLRLVNSAFYSLRAPISSIRQASSLLGIRTLKSLALSVSVINIFKRRLSCFDPILFWRHALAVALLGPKIGQHLRIVLQDEIYITGLLHDIGVALLVQHFPDDYLKLARPGSEGTRESLAREAEEFGLAHPEVAYSLAAQWRLPTPVALGLRYHHTPPEQLPADLDPEVRKLILVVQLADVFVRRSGYSFAETDRLDPAQPLAVPEELGLAPDAVPGIAGELDKAITELEGLYFEAAPQAAKTEKVR